MTKYNKTLAILASWSLVRDRDKIFIPTTHHIYLSFVSTLYQKVYLISPMTENVGSKKGRELSFDNVEVVPLPFNGSYIGAVKNFGAYKKVLDEVCPKVDVVYCRVPDPFSWMPALIFKKKCIMHFVGDAIDATKHNEKWSWFKKQLMLLGYMPEYALTLKAARRSKVFTNGHHISDKLSRKDIIATPVVSSTVFQADLHDDFKKLPIECDKIILTYVGYIRYAKGMHCLMHFCKRLKSENIDFHFNIIGNGEMFDDVKLFIEEEQLQDRITMFGHIDDKNKMNIILRGSDLFFFPSLSEGSPRVVIEAMAQGVPVMSTPVGSLPTTFKNGETIRFFDYNDVDNAFNVIKEFMNDTEPFEKQRKNAFKMVSDEITIEKFLSKVFAYET